MIAGLTDNFIDRNILQFFSENNYSDSTLQQASQLFNVSTKYITDLFNKLKEKFKDKSLNF